MKFPVADDPTAVMVGGTWLPIRRGSYAVDTGRGSVTFDVSGPQYSVINYEVGIDHVQALMSQVDPVAEP